MINSKLSIFKPGLDKFLHYLKYEKQLSIKTIEAYKRDLLKTITAAEKMGINRWGGLRTANLRQIISQYYRKGLGGRSLQRNLSALRELYRFLLREKIVSINPTIGLRAPKTDRKLPSVLDVDTINALLNFQPKSLLEYRDKAMLELFYSSGLRVSELASVDRANIDLQDSLITVTGKGSKTRVIPVGAKANYALNDWLKQRTTIVPSNEAKLFISRQGRPLTTRAIQLRIKHWAKKQGLWERVYPHLIRHSFASHMLESSGDLRAVQELLGHANLNTTQIYTHLNFQHLAEVYDKAHPRAQRKK